MIENANIAVVTNSFDTSVDVASPVVSAPISIDRFDDLRPMLRREFGDTAYRSWIAPIEAVSLKAGTLELAVPTRLIRDWVKSHYADYIRNLWSQQVAPLARVDIVINAAAKTRTTAFAAPAVANQNAAAAESVLIADTVSSPLDPRYTFDNFVIGSANELAAAAMRKTVESETVSFNPLYIHGSFGHGKTHLLQAAAHLVRGNKDEKRVVYMSAEKFMYHFVRALRLKDTMAFKERVRSVDILMIDDIQFICGKEQTQAEFLQTFKALIDMGKQVIVTADRAPSDLEGIDDALKSRLAGGLAIEIKPADADLRFAVLKSKCALLKRALPDDALNLLSSKITSSIRELEGALNRLIAFAEFTGKPMTYDTAEELMKDLLRAQERKVSIEEIQKKVAEHYRIRLADLLSPRRARPVARPRQVAMYLAKVLTTHSLPEIGRKFSGRDHTTIIHGIRKIEALMDIDANLKSDVDALKRAMA